MAVAVYFLDKLALRAGHEKDDDEADTVGCLINILSVLAPHCVFCCIPCRHPRAIPSPTLPLPLVH